MRFKKSTLYALRAALVLAAATEPVTVGDVATRYAIPPGALAKVLQQLVHAGIAEGQRGIGGGYRLARSAATVTVQDVISAFDGARTSPLGPEPPENGATEGDRRLWRLFDEVQETARCTFASVTLETLLREGGR